MPHYIGTCVPSDLNHRCNSGLANAALGPIALIALVARGAGSAAALVINPKNSAIGATISHDLNGKGWKAVAATIVNKTHLFLSSVIGTVAWTTIAYSIATLINGGTSLVLFKAIAAIALAFASLPAFPWILTGIVLFCGIVAIANLYVSTKPNYRNNERDSFYGSSYNQHNRRGSGMSSQNSQRNGNLPDE